MTRFTSETPSQERIAGIVTTVDSIVNSPVVVGALEQDGATPDVGRGLIEYRAGIGILSCSPQEEGDTPAEISYYPEISSRGVIGAIYRHGIKSHRLEEGKLASFHFGDRVKNGHYVDHLEVRLRDGELQIGHPDERGELLPVSDEDISAAEANLAQLLEHVESLEATA